MPVNTIFDTFTLSMVFFGIQSILTVIFALTTPVYNKKYLSLIAIGLGLEAVSIIFALLDFIWAPFVLNMLLMGGSVHIITGLLLIVGVEFDRKLIYVFFTVHTILFFYFTIISPNLEIRLLIYAIEISFIIVRMLKYYLKDVQKERDFLKVLLMLMYVGYMVLVIVRGINAVSHNGYEQTYFDLLIHHVYLYYGIMFTSIRGLVVILVVAKEFQSDLRALSYVDHLTNVDNIRSLMEKVSYELKRCRRYDKCMTLALVDLDDFKVVNDTFGHVFGDEVLIVFAHLAKKELRGIDTIGRYGGEEFLMIFPETDSSEAAKAVERIMATLSENIWSETDVNITFSTGLLQVTKEMFEYDPRTLVDMADRAMYRAKSTGKNRIVKYEEV